MELVRAAMSMHCQNTCDAPQVAGSFVNMRLSDDYHRRPCAMATEENCGLPRVSNRRFVVDYSSLNIARRCTLGIYARRLLGDALANCLELRGQCIRQNHA